MLVWCGGQLGGTRILLVAAGPTDAARLGLAASRCVDPGSAWVVRIADTLTVSEIAVSPTLVGEVADHDRLTALADLALSG